MTIHVRNWEKFQHADVTKRKMRVPKWIRLFTELGSKQEFRALTMHQRGILVSIWIEYARSGRQLPDSTATLTRQLGQRVMTRDLEALNQAGFIEFRQDTVTTPSSLEERRRERTVRSDVVEDVPKGFDPDELEAWQPPDEENAETGVVVELDSRRPGGEVNGRPSSEAVGDVMEALLRARASP